MTAAGSYKTLTSKGFYNCAAPVAYWAMTKWLQDFAFRISISWWMIAIAGSAAVIIALFTICFHSIKAALMNPVKSIRTE